MRETLLGKGNSTDFINYNQNDIDAMKVRAKGLSKKAGYTSSQVNNGIQVLDKLKEATAKEGSIESVVFFSHATGDGLILDHNDGFYTENKTYAGDNSANVSNLKYSVDNGEIKFENNASIVLAGCNCANPGKLSDVSIAESITNKTGVTTYAATGQINLMKGKETNQLFTDGTFIKYEQVTTIIPIEPGKKVPIYPPIVITETKKTDVGKMIQLK
jgi:hypothetical protein